jgi:hypothetical protein
MPAVNCWSSDQDASLAAASQIQCETQRSRSVGLAGIDAEELKFRTSTEELALAVNVNEIFKRGGRGLIDFLEYCVLTVNKDLVFVYLVHEYQLRPTAIGATGLFDMFCAANAPAKISVVSLLPPKDRRLEMAIEIYRARPSAEGPNHAPAENSIASEHGTSENDALSPPEALPDDAAPASRHVPLPPRYLFDPIVQRITTDASASITAIEQNYDPTLTPHENLPDGRLNAGQRAFVEYTWLPIVRPHLVAAGFWRIATVA